MLHDVMVSTTLKLQHSNDCCCSNTHRCFSITDLCDSVSAGPPVRVIVPANAPGRPIR